ncbi:MULTISPECIES: DUF1192 domain-containing protein [unclassified Rhizobium]|uniref:DUF1192 domain-containing protein n=1 Tax=unclassified Rhizobium TaxID=2613769 RepID=UPI0006F66450|nr:MULTISPECIES: DUF1192 domain-containing protein [unclassified Rhizobium]KQV35113.1 hypothetical protein ASC86_12925 [Rhizobium sp. Root1212]KRD24918.1 hypothetical protein ASE37_12920 [Rhizobium sp. Root268]
MSLFDDDLPKKKPAHELGCDLSQLSVDELANRVGVLRQEIERLEAAIAQKSASKSAAESIFRR